MVLWLNGAPKPCLTTAASIWFEIRGGSWIRVKNVDFRKISIFSGNFTKTKSIFPGKFPKKFDFSGNLRKISNFQDQIGHLKLGYFLASYSISLQKSPLSNILPIHDKI